MRRVVIIGRGASGKSVLAVQLAHLTRLPLVELDKVFWQPGLVATPRDQWVAIQQKLVKEESWIIEGDLGPDDVVDVRICARSARAATLLARMSRDARMAGGPTVDAARARIRPARNRTRGVSNEAKRNLGRHVSALDPLADAPHYGRHRPWDIEGRALKHCAAHPP